MCYRGELKASKNEISKRYNALFEDSDYELFSGEINGFAHPTHPLIIDKAPAKISTDFRWGLIPSFCKDDSIKKNTLNAKIETLDEKPSFKNVISNRCLIILTGYYEWRWNDEKGKDKQKFVIHSVEDQIFSLAAIYSYWINPISNEKIGTFSIVTTQANEKMQYVHNIKKRMPVLLKKKDELAWLDSNIDYREFAYPNYNAEILALTV